MAISTAFAVLGLIFVIWSKKLALLMYVHLQRPWSGILPMVASSNLMVSINRWGFITITSIASLVYGILVIFGVIKTGISKDDELSRKLLSERDRYLLGRYNAGFKFVIAGLGAAALGLTMHFSR